MSSSCILSILLHPRPETYAFFFKPFPYICHHSNRRNPSKKYVLTPRNLLSLLPDFNKCTKNSILLTHLSADQVPFRRLAKLVTRSYTDMRSNVLQKIKRTYSSEVSLLHRGKHFWISHSDRPFVLQPNNPNLRHLRTQDFLMTVMRLTTLSLSRPAMTP